VLLLRFLKYDFQCAAADGCCPLAPAPPALLQLLSPMQQARLAAAAWPWYPDPAKWAPLLVGAAAAPAAPAQGQQQQQQAQKT
jgi:hypothetical protein